MKRTLALVLGLSAPLLFPAVLAAIVVLAACLVLPPVGLLAGLLTDALYRTPATFPYATVLGAFATLCGFGVRQLIKTRIMGA